MLNETNASDLIQEIQKNRELYSPFGEKPQGLKRSEIIERVKGFLIDGSSDIDDYIFTMDIA